jgi:hypothetical protein
MNLAVNTMSLKRATQLTYWYTILKNVMETFLSIPGHEGLSFKFTKFDTCTINIFQF